MKIQMNWQQGMSFEASSDQNTVITDAKSPIGSGKALTPKELVGVGLGGCTAMDVVALLKKHKQLFETFNVDIDIKTTTTYPVVFTEAEIKFSITGNVDSKILIEAVTLSQTKYCGVSAMLCKAFPIQYVIELNGETIGHGQAQFNI